MQRGQPRLGSGDDWPGARLGAAPWTTAWWPCVEVCALPDIELKQIQPNKLNPRLKFSKSGLDDLAASIRQYGILEPIIVRPMNSHYEVVVGERRYRAAQQAGLDEVPVIVRSYSDEEVMEINLVENVQREDLSA